MEQLKYLPLLNPVVRRDFIQKGYYSRENVQPQNLQMLQKSEKRAFLFYWE